RAPDAGLLRPRGALGRREDHARRAAVGLGLPAGLVVQLSPAEAGRQHLPALCRRQCPHRRDDGVSSRQPTQAPARVRSRGDRRDLRGPDVPVPGVTMSITILAYGGPILASGSSTEDGSWFGLLFLLAGPLFYSLIYLRYRNVDKRSEERRDGK